MKKYVLLLTVMVLCASLLTGCCLSHEWAEASCAEPKTCIKCGETEGEALGHEWQDATCEIARTCASCSKKDGNALGHKYETIEVLDEATYTSYGKIIQSCSACGKEIEKLVQPLDHDFKITVNKCTTTQKCKKCGYNTQSVNHKEWYFSSNYNIVSCNLSDLYFTGTITCKTCRTTKQGAVTYSAEEFEKIFCSWVSTGNYDDIARYPEDNANYVMKFTGYILQDCGNNLYRMSTSGRYDDVILVEFVGETAGRILEDDRVTVYGQPDLLYTYTSTFGAKITIPKFIAYYIHY